MVGKVVWQRRVQQFLSVVLIISMVLPMGLVKAQPLEPATTGDGTEITSESPVASWQPAPVPLALPMGLEFNTFDGSLSLGCDEISLPHGDLPLSFGLTWNSDRGWSNNQKIFYWEDLGFVGGEGHSLTYVTGIRFNLAQYGILAFPRNPDGTFEAPPGYAVTRNEGYSPIYELKTPDGTRYYFDNAYHRYVTKIQSPSGKYLAFSYDPTSSQAYLNKISDTFGRSLSFAHDDKGRLTTVTDANITPPRSLSYSYDASGQLVTSSDPLGHVTQYGYANGRLSSITDPAGAVTTIQYVEKVENDKIRGEYNRPRASQVSMPAAAYYFAYQLAGTAAQLPVVTDTTTVRLVDGGVERTTIYEYLSGLPVKITDPAGGVTRMSWNQDGRMASISDQNNHTTSYEYDSLGNQVAMTDPLSQTTTYRYEPLFNLVASITDPAGGQTTFTYDSAGNLLSQTDPLSRTVQFEWQGDRISRIIEPGNRVTEFGYNQFDYPVVITDSLGNRRTATYDNAGSVLALTDAEGNTVHFAYDAAGNITGNTDALGYGFSAAYDPAGNLATMSDPSGRIARFQYDQAGRLTAVVDPQGGQTAYQYDALGNLTQIADPAGQVTRYRYDIQGNRTAEFDALGNTVVFGYDPAGNLTSRTDAQGRATTYTYDAANRLTKIDYPGSNDATFGYDGAGRLISEANDDVQLTYNYDAAGQLDGVQIAPFGKTISYTYNAAGQRISMIDPDGGETVYAYDGAGNLATLTDPQNRTTTFSWDRDGRLLGQEFDGGATITRTLDAAGQIVKQVASSPGAGILFSNAYRYDPAGNRLSVEDKDGGLISYAYDALYQLSEAKYPDGNVIQYRYDQAGNRLRHVDGAGEVSYSYDAANRLLAMGDVTYAYDADGNRIGMSDGAQTVSYSYNEENLLTQIQPSGGQAVTFSYYPDGRRLSRTDGSGSSYYFYDHDNVLLETDQSGATTASYTSWAVDRWLTADQAGQSVDYIQDPLGTVLGLIDPAGNLAAAYAYDPFGRSQVTGGAPANPFQFAGRRYEDGWYYNRFRIYDPVSGRFTTRDPAGIPDGPNRYLYVLNNPTTYIDPYGLACGKPTSFGDCHQMCFKFLNPAVVQMAGLFAGSLSMGLERKAVDFGNRLLATSTTKDWLSAAYKPKEPWWSSGLSALANVTGSILTAGATLAKTSVLGIVGGVLAGWAAGTFAGCTAACLADKEAYDFTANCALKRLLEWEPEDPEEPPDEPGGDHPDENRSAASPRFAMAETLVYRQDPYIGLLWRGYAEEAGSLINQIGEMYRPVDLAFDPNMADTLPVLVIPSGGLYGLENSGSFKARLESYVAAGGTIISFAQQDGDHFSVLPAPAAGDSLGGYGWREDNSCFRTSLYISEYHPLLSGIDSHTIDAHVDGYFTTLPAGATELLNRMKNGQPGLVLYRYPSANQGGYVLSTTIYDDWGGPNRQLTADAVALTRDMLSWAYGPEEPLVELGPGESSDLAVEVKNQSNQAAAKIKLIARQPDRSSAEEQVVALALPAGGSAVANMAVDVPVDPQLGIWWVDYILLDATEVVVQDQAVGARFVVSDPSPITGPGRDLFLSITAPTDRYGSNTIGDFTFHVFNQGDTARDVEIRYGLPHHTWEGNDPSYGEFNKLIQPLSVAANSEATFVYTPTLFTNDRLWSSLYEGDQLRDQAHFAVYNVSFPDLGAAVETDDQRYPPAGAVTITATLANQGAASVNAELRIRVRDAGNNQLHEQSTFRQLASYGSISHQTTYTLPEEAADGVYTVYFETLIDGNPAKVSTARFTVISHLITVAITEPPIYEPDVTNNVTFTLQNAGFLDISQGAFTVTNTSPGEATIYNQSQSFSLAVGGSADLVFPVAMTNEFGTYRLDYAADYHGHSLQGAVEVPLRNVIQLDPDQTPYQAGQSGRVEVQVTNTGRFRQAPSVTVEVPMATFSQTHVLGHFTPGEMLTEPFTISVPLETMSGDYPVTATLTLDSGSSESASFTIFVPPAKFNLAAPDTATAGETITLTLTNVGGASAAAGYNLVLNDYGVLQSMSGAISSTHPGFSQPVTITLDPALPTAAYSINGRVQAAPGQSARVNAVMAVDGVEASLVARTDSPAYQPLAPISATAAITSTGTPLPGAPVSLQILSSISEERWVEHRTGDHSLPGMPLSFFTDSRGWKWFGGGESATALDDGGTPIDSGDDIWRHFEARTGLELTNVYAINEDPEGRIWIGHNYGLVVLDHNGTLIDGSDDRVQAFSSGPSSDRVFAIAFEGTNLVWLGTAGDTDSEKTLRVLDHNGTPFDTSDDQWQYFGPGDGIVPGIIYSLLIDDSGIKWIGNEWTNYNQLNLSVLDDGGTALDKADDSAAILNAPGAQGFPTVISIELDPGGILWLGAMEGGLYAYDPGADPVDGSDDTWQRYINFPGSTDKYAGRITIAPDGLLWFPSCGAYYECIIAFDDGGTPFNSGDDQWWSFPIDDWDTGYRRLAIEHGRYIWLTAWNGAQVIDYAGTLGDKSDDGFQSYEGSEGRELSDDRINTLAIDAAGRVWIASAFGFLTVLDNNGTAVDKRDDRWQLFKITDGLKNLNVGAIFIDPAGPIWTVGSNVYGISVLDHAGTPFDKSDDAWQHYDSNDQTFLNFVITLAVDDTGLEWFGASRYVLLHDDGGTLLDKSDDVWLQFDENDGLPRPYPSYPEAIDKIVIDDQGLKWFVADLYTTIYDDGGTPFDKQDDTYTKVRPFADSSLVDDFIIDPLGIKWYVSAYGNSVRALDDGGTPLDTSDDSWQTFTTSDGLPQNRVPKVVSDDRGRIWFSTYPPVVLDYGGTLLDKSDDVWKTVALVDDTTTAMASAGSGGIWFGTSWEGVRNVVDERIALWQTSTQVDLPSGATPTAFEIITGAVPISDTGKYYLEARLESPIDRPIAVDSYPFYVFGSDTGLTLAADRPLYKPNQTITLTGEVLNNGGATLVGQAITITQNGAAVYTAGPFDVPVGGSHPYIVTTTAPTSPGEIYFKAFVDGVVIEDQVSVVAPQVEATISGPDEAGSEPFTVTVMLHNSGRIEAAVDVNLGGAPHAMVLQPGQVRYIQESFQIQGDTLITAGITGDAVQTLNHLVEYGLSAAVAFSVEDAYCAGWASIPYTLTNTGHFELTFTTQLTLAHELEPATYEQIKATLPVSGSHEGQMVTELLPGHYDLAWQHPFGDGQASFTALGFDLASMSVISGPVLGGQAPLTVTVDNGGCNPFNGAIVVDAIQSGESFYSQDRPLNLAIGGSQIVSFSVGTNALNPGPFTMTARLLAPDRTPLDSFTTTVSIPGPDLILSAMPAQTSLSAGAAITLAFEVQNQGEAADQVNLTFKLGDFEDERQSQWIDVGESGRFEYAFYLPADLTAVDLLAGYALSGDLSGEVTQGTLIFPLNGISLTVDASTDQPLYLDGDPITLSLSVTNDGAGETGDLAAMVSYQGITQTQIFSLAVGSSTSLDFPLNATFDGDPVVFYGIYYAGTDRSILLDTYRPQRRWPAVTVLTDKQLYRPGETVYATVVTSLTMGTLAIQAPGYEGEAPLSDGQAFSFSLPQLMARGTYQLQYTPAGSGSDEDGRQRTTPFDVDGPIVFVREASLRQLPGKVGDQVILDLMIDSDRALDATLAGWLEYPDGTLSAELGQALALLPAANNQAAITLTLAEGQLGVYQFHYKVLQEGQGRQVTLVKGLEAFDLGLATLEKLTTDADAYPETDDLVVAQLRIFAAEPGPALVELEPDDGPATSRPITLTTGFQTITVTLNGPIPAGRRQLTAALIVGGFQVEANTAFDYGTNLADLAPGAPELSPTGEVTRTLSTMVSNLGASRSEATTARFYDGDPYSGGALIGVAAVPALDPGEVGYASVEWDIQEAGGDHILHVDLEPVVEFDTGNNRALTAVTLPRFATELALAPQTIEVGQEMMVRTHLRNLQAHSPLALSMKVSIYAPGGALVTSQTQVVNLAPGEDRWLSESWVATEAESPGYYAVLLEVWQESGAYQLSSASAIVTEVSSHEVYLPLLIKN